jgi:hypothetical protein
MQPIGSFPVSSAICIRTSLSSTRRPKERNAANRLGFLCRINSLRNHSRHMQLGPGRSIRRYASCSIGHRLAFPPRSKEARISTPSCLVHKRYRELSVEKVHDLNQYQTKADITNERSEYGVTDWLVVFEIEVRLRRSTQERAVPSTQHVVAPRLSTREASICRNGERCRGPSVVP